MSSELIASYYSAFNARDYEAMLRLLSEDVVHDVNQGGRELGRAAFQAFLARMDESYREQLVDVVIMGDTGGGSRADPRASTGTRFAAEFTVVGAYLKADAGMPPAHGQHYRLPAGAFLVVDEGKITRVTTYYNLADWLAQVSGHR